MNCKNTWQLKTRFLLSIGMLNLLLGCSSVTGPDCLGGSIEFNKNSPNADIDMDDGINTEIDMDTEGITQRTPFTRPELISRIEAYLNTLKGAGFSGAVLVAQNGEIIFEGGYGLADRDKNIPITPETIFDTGSLSKQFTAATILHLEEQGQLQVEDTLANFFDDVPPDKANITLHQLLTHSSGLPGYVYAGDFEETTRQEAITLAFNARLESPPGTEYLYSDTGYGLLAAIVEIVSGQSFQTYLKQYFFDSAGMTKTGFYNDPQWAEMTIAHGYNNGKDFGSAAVRPGPYWGLLGFGGVLTTVGDLYLWNEALANNLILSETSITKLFTPYIQEGNEDSYYGYGWAIRDLPDYGKMISHNGATDSQNAMMIMYEDPKRTLVVVLSNRIDEGLLRETFYGTDTSLALGCSILKQDFNQFPAYAH